MNTKTNAISKYRKILEEIKSLDFSSLRDEALLLESNKLRRSSSWILLR